MCCVRTTHTFDRPHPSKLDIAEEVLTINQHPTKVEAACTTGDNSEPEGPIKS